MTPVPFQPPHTTAGRARAGRLVRHRRPWLGGGALLLLCFLWLPAVPGAEQGPDAADPAAPELTGTPGPALAPGEVPAPAVAIRTRRGGWLPEVNSAAGGPGGDPIVAVRLRSPVRIRYRLLPGDDWRGEGEAAVIAPDAAGALGFAARSGLPLRYRVYSHEAGWSAWSASGDVAGWPAQGYLLRGIEVLFGGRLPHPRDPLPPRRRPQARPPPR